MATTAQKITTGAVAVAIIVVLTLPGRQTVPVLTAGKRLVTGETRTLMGR